MELTLPDWSTFKAICIIKKNLNCQYVENPGTYSLIGPDNNGINWTLELTKNNDDGTATQDAADFIQNHVSTFNFPISSSPNAFAVSDYQFAPVMMQDTCPAGQSNSSFFKIKTNCLVNGGMVITNGNAVFGDTISFALVDHENLLKQGVDTVLYNWVPQWGVDWKNCLNHVETPYAGIPTIGMYFRFTYNSTGLLTPVGYIVNYLIHIPI